MTTTLERQGDLQAFRAEIRARANALFKTPQHKRMFDVPMTFERAQLWALQNVFWTLNRRDCWGFAQGLAPLEVKRLIWDHEEDELAGNKARGVDPHRSLLIQQGALLGLTPDDFRNAEIREGTRTCAYAWIHLVKDSHWLKAIAACGALEISNSSEWVDGGGVSFRRGMIYQEQLGIPFDKQISHKEHAEVDVEHANLFMKVAEQYASTKQDLDLMLEGAVESWEIETTWKGIIADMMLELAESGVSKP